MRIGGFTDISTSDWPGNVSMVIFFAGCNFSCPYCHNPQLISIDSGYEFTIEELDQYIEQSLWLLDSIVVSGGEVLVQGDALRDVLKLARKHRLKTMIETNGSRPDVMRLLLKEKLIDYIALDFKTTPNKYSKLGGEAPFEAINILMEYNIPFEIRTTLAPDFTDEKDLKIIMGIIPEGVKWVQQECVKVEAS